ncbi:Uncharacterised protein [Mycobacteroides abscessus subsp. abscessus]|nr:Uncharacterised protein [Mycobacteroides abscessus subsp. abscessus]
MVSVCPKPSRISTPQASCTRVITRASSGSPAETASRGGVRSRVRSARISIRHTVGGAQKLVTDSRSITAISAAASKRE